jgi:hypothetical protein
MDAKSTNHAELLGLLLLCSLDVRDAIQLGQLLLADTWPRIRMSKERFITCSSVAVPLEAVEIKSDNPNVLVIRGSWCKILEQ